MAARNPPQRHRRKVLTCLSHNVESMNHERLLSYTLMATKGDISILILQGTRWKRTDTLIRGGYIFFSHLAWGALVLKLTRVA